MIKSQNQSFKSRGRVQSNRTRQLAGRLPNAEAEQVILSGTWSFRIIEQSFSLL